jgi:hypothetical protein
MKEPFAEGDKLFTERGVRLHEVYPMQIFLGARHMIVLVPEKKCGLSVAIKIGSEGSQGDNKDCKESPEPAGEK